jgi:hypothetical protein
MIEEFSKHNIFNPWTRKPYKESAVRRVINEKYGGYREYILNSMNKTNVSKQ